ncbi:MAG: sigma-70 family RNA polymerase sigma factor [Bacteroidota bacterium]
MSVSDYNDSKLVSNYINGDESAIEVLIYRHKTKIYNFIYSKIGDRDLTEDIFQDTFIKVINTLKRKKYNEEGRFLSWVMRIAHNLVIDHFRKENRLPKYSNKSDFDVFLLVKDDKLNIENELIKSQIESDVKLLIEQLPDEQKEVLKMRHYNDLSFKEIAENTGVSINTALGRMRYALINLKKMIEEKNLILH